METKTSTFTTQQLVFKELFVGTLIYATVLGFFNDYTSIVYTKSFSTIFFAAIILQILTYLTLLLKGKVLFRFKAGESARYKALMLFFAWLVLFLSKFVFIWAIDFAFGDDIAIHGFFGITGVVMAVTLAHKMADTLFKALGASASA